VYQFIDPHSSEQSFLLLEIVWISSSITPAHHHELLEGTIEDKFEIIQRTSSIYASKMIVVTNQVRVHFFPW
jgi:hypothetical protein